MSARVCVCVGVGVGVAGWVQRASCQSASITECSAAAAAAAAAVATERLGPPVYAGGCVGAWVQQQLGEFCKQQALLFSSQADGQPLSNSRNRATRRGSNSSSWHQHSKARTALLGTGQIFDTLFPSLATDTGACR